jgi:catechol 2,3-dioxygenase-like lactoylglutathione lyase family enzyme
LHVGLRVSDLERSLTFYRAVGYTVVGTVEGTASGSLSMLQLRGDHFVTVELVHDPAREEPTSVPASITFSSRLNPWMQPWPILPSRVSRSSHPAFLAARTDADQLDH